MTINNPKNSVTLAQYIRKYRKDKGLLIRELAHEIGIHKFTLIKWEGGRMPRQKDEIRKLMKAVPRVGRFLTVWERGPCKKGKLHHQWDNRRRLEPCYNTGTVTPV